MSVRESRNEAPLESWKDIASYLQRQVRTVRRWEKEEGLPVHRHSHKSRSSVYAYPSEIDAWRAGRRLVAEPPPAMPLWKTLLAPQRSLAFGVTLTLCLIMVGNGVRPVSAQQAPMQARRIWADARGGGADSFSPDGRYITYADWDSGNLVVHDLETGTNRPLTNDGSQLPGTPGWAERSSISPDGRQVAYCWWDTKLSGYEIRIVPLQATAILPPRTVYQYPQGNIVPFGWSPDLKLLYVERALADRTVQLAVLSIEDGSVRVLKSMGWMGVQASLSPDGRYIAYDPPVGDGAPSSDIAILATDGSQETVIVNHPAKDFSPMWSPDGRSVIFLSDRTGKTSLWSVPVVDGKATGEPVLLKADAGQILPKGITRDGALYYEGWGDGARNIYLAELDANLKVTKTPVLATERFLNSNFHPSWSPDGESLAYYSGREGFYRRPLGPLGPEVNTVLVIRSARTGKEKDIRLPLQVPAYPIVAGPKWFPDGRSVLVIGWVSERPGFGYFRVDLETGKTTLLHRPQNTKIDGGRLDLSPDGKSIYYVDSIPHGALRRFDIETRQDQEVRKLYLPATQIAISPDGTQIAFTQDAAVYIALVGGGEPRLLFTMTQGDARNTLAWTPDQKYLLYTQSNEAVKPVSYSLWRIAVAGGEPQKLGISVIGEIKTPRLNPDGRRLVYETIESHGTGEEIWTLENFLPKSKGK